ncbi:hypothetical protein CN689_05640 [Peribacillus butanolivorans]|uniref:Uncharacterized protein n=1 Tax=Peribacillus butanolivorans TaxID=421767 RepID=A0AAX0S5D8_9BACI|nr:hypothetical protein [Peribacillus butanolivorans]PEJ35940.1 hypothetical protein CN689_05640 [Peribacillus butanolivorans]
MYYQESIEYKVDSIYHAKTKEYFNEVYSSYNNGNYRSAMVMLYSVVVCDLIYKLQELSDRYNDSIAVSILEKVKKEQKENPGNPKWETTLITEINERTNLLETQDALNIDYLRKHRHLSAHPVLDQLDMLVKPNKETVRANIMNMLEGILCKAPLLSKKFISTFLEDLISVKDQLIKDNEFENYLNSKYLSKINRPTEEKLFRDIWKFTFRLEDAKTNENRDAIYRALLVLYEKDKVSFNSMIDSDKSYFSHISLENEKILNLIVEFMSLFPLVFNSMEESVKLIIKTKADNSIDIFSKSIFLSESFTKHIEAIISRMESAFIPGQLSDSGQKLLFKVSKEQDAVNQLLDLFIYIFSASRSYDRADINFQNYIFVYGDLFSREHFIKILEAINKNSQLYERRQAWEDNTTLKELINMRFKDEIDFENYPNIRL